jgi:hypothetical protein
MISLLSLFIISLMFVGTSASIQTLQTTEIEERLVWSITRLTLAFFLQGVTVSIRYIPTLRHLPGDNNTLVRGDDLRMTMHKLKICLFVLQFVVELWSSGRTLTRRTMVYMIARVFRVTKNTAAGHLMNAMLDIGTISGVPRSVLPIVAQSEIFIFGTSEIMMGGNVYLRFNGELKTLDNTFPRAVFMPDEMNPAPFCPSFEQTRIVFLEKEQQAKDLWQGLNQNERTSTIVIGLTPTLTFQIRCFLAFLLAQARFHGKQVTIFGRGDSDLGGYETMLGIEYDENDRLAPSEKCLLQEIRLLGPVPQEDHHFGANNLNLSLFADTMSNNDFNRIERALQRTTANQDESLNRQRHLAGFTQNRRTLQDEFYPKQEKVRYWINEMNRISPL